MAQPYELSVDGAPPLSVHAIDGVEALSEPWSFDVVVTGPEGHDLERSALGRQAGLVIRTGEAERAFYGVVAGARCDEGRARGEARYTLRIVPRLWLLKRRKRSRVFQRLSVPAVVTAVLGEAGIGVVWQLGRVHPARELCTQYEETDERFVRRLLAEAGIFYSFFSGGPVPHAALAAALSSAVGTAAGALSSAAGGVVGDAIATGAAAAAAAPTFIPGDTVICADDASAYRPLGDDDPARFVLSTVASLAAATPLAGPAAGVATMALGAVSSLVAPDSPTLRFGPFDAGGATHPDRVARFTLANTLRSTGAAFRDFDPAKPNVHLESSAGSTAPFPPTPAEAAQIAAAAAKNNVSAAAGAATSVLPDGAAPVVGAVAGAVTAVSSAVLSATSASEVYEHHAPFLFPKWEVASDQAPLILKQKRRRASLGRGESAVLRLTPGQRFALADHPSAQLDGDYALVRVAHRGDPREARSYTNTFECVPASMAYVPARPKRRAIQTTVTATTVGPAAEEIHVDSEGRIKVQFHWDREGRLDGESSCWIRVMQPWGGAAWGVQFIPRVGMEVVVGFEGGDPDKPMVLGTLYNGTHPPAFRLPEDKTRSGWKTSSSPGGKGYNELSFEDRAGAEEIRVHAQRDMLEVVGRDHDTRVTRDRRSVIEGDRFDDTAGNARWRTAKERSEQVGESYSLAVGDNRRLAVYGSDSELVAGQRTTEIRGRHGIQVGGTLSTMVGTKEQTATSESFVWGNWLVGANGAVEITAEQGLTLRCGDSVVELTKHGVKINGTKVDLKGKDSVSFTGDGPSLELADEAKLNAKKLSIVSSKASLVMDDDASLDAKNVKFNCKGIGPWDREDPTKEPETKKFSVRLVDAKNEPHANKEYLLTAGGARFEGSTDGDGKIEVDVPKAAEVAKLVVYVGERPEGEQIKYEMKLSEPLPPASSPLGLLTRLWNLHYFGGEPRDEIDQAGRDAIRRFQRANELEPTGEPDAKTIAKLEEVHGH